MSQLSILIAAVVAARAEYDAICDAEWVGPFPRLIDKHGQRSAANVRLGNAETALIDYCLAHAAEYAERERLEAALVAVARDEPPRLQAYAMSQHFMDAVAELVSWLRAHAADESETM